MEPISFSAFQKLCKRNYSDDGGLEARWASHDYKISIYRQPGNPKSTWVWDFTYLDKSSGDFYYKMHALNKQDFQMQDFASLNSLRNYFKTNHAISQHIKVFPLRFVPAKVFSIADTSINACFLFTEEKWCLKDLAYPLKADQTSNWWKQSGLSSKTLFKNKTGALEAFYSVAISSDFWKQNGWMQKAG